MDIINLSYEEQSVNIVEERSQVVLYDVIDSIQILDQTENSVINLCVENNTVIILDDIDQVVVLDIIETINLINEYGSGGTGGGGSCTGDCANAPIKDPSVGEWIDGLNQWTETTKIKDALYELNLIEKYLAPSDAGSLDGKDLSLQGSALLSGRLSDGNVNYKPGISPGASASNILHNGTIILLSPDQLNSFNKADKGNIQVYINGSMIDTFDLSTFFVEANRDTYQAYPPRLSVSGYLTITDVRAFNNFPIWQKGTCSMEIPSSMLRKGYNYIQLKHTGLSTDQESNVFELFKDEGTVSPSIFFTSLVENYSVYKHLSGVKFFGRTSTFYLNCYAQNVFDNTYHSISPVIYSSTLGTLGTGTIDYNDSSVNGISNPPRTDDLTMNISNKVLTVPSSNVRSMNALVGLQSRKPWASSATIFSESANRMIDAYGITSTPLNEYFDDENRRLGLGSYNIIPSDIVAQWNSQAFLSNGQAQVYNGQLIYPKDNFTTKIPGTGQPDYSSFFGPQRYFRVYISSGNPHNSGILRIVNGGAIVSPVGSGSLNVEIKLPGTTGFMDLGKPFDSGTFTGSDGQGCRVSVSGNDYTWTSGTFSTAYSGWMYVIRVTLLNNTVAINEISEVNW